MKLKEDSINKVTLQLLFLLYISVLRMKLLEHFRAGFVAALPYLAMAIVVQVGGHLADYVRRRGILSTTATRKVTTSGGNLSCVREHIKALFTRNKI